VKRAYDVLEFLLSCSWHDDDFKFGILKEAADAANEVAEFISDQDRNGFWKFLLDCIDDVPIIEALLVQAASNAPDCTRFLAALFKCNNNAFQMTPKVVKAAVENHRDDGTILELLIDLAGNKVPISHALVLKVARLCTTDTLCRLLVGRGECSAALAASTAVAGIAPSAIQDFASSVRSDPRTDRVVANIFRSDSLGPAMMKSLLDLGYDVPVSENLALELRSITRKAWPNTRDDKEEMLELLASRGLLREEIADGLRK
jgi:hypothetical protein